jgi:HAD superfamily hydrolase (TIGR01509 family)
MTEISVQLSLDSSLVPQLVNKKQSLVREKFNHLEEPPLFPGTKSCLELISKNYKIGLCTSASRPTVEVFFRSGIPEDLFQCVISAESVVKGKPDPEIYSSAMHILGAAPMDCVIVEDSISGIIAGITSGSDVFHIGNHASLGTLREEYLDKVTSFHDLEAMTRSLVCL